MVDVIRPLDRERLRAEFRRATPFPFICIDDFLDPSLAEAAAASYPTFEGAQKMGLEFKWVNEQRKVQITDTSKFPEPVRTINEALASQDFLETLSYVTGIPKLLADPELTGGGMHITGAGGRLDVHVDFNYIKERKLHRRLNILVYLNRAWEQSWGGQIELWDREVKTCGQSFNPAFNRCLIFETSETSYHGVRPLTCPPEVARISFAGYYYTAEAPEHWQGVSHSTIFKARPDEFFRGAVLMPVAVARKRVTNQIRRAGRLLKRLLPS
jgi:Rps23 Pro-64 3,4-dihydroxylase Tpa1-like proline 4-hydroxylase